MPLDKPQVDQILQLISSSSLELRLRAIEDAIALHKTMFRDEMSPEQWAYAALICESLYNTTRDILKEGYKTLRPISSDGSSPTPKPRQKSSPSTSAKKSKIPLSQNPEAIAELKAIFFPQGTSPHESK